MNDDAITLDASNLSAIAGNLPATARATLSALVNLPRGSLRAVLPDGRRVRVAGRAPGPDAELILRNWKLPRRALLGGTIGLAESYLDGDWESPDVTTFLELFAVNREAGDELAGGTSWLLNALQQLRHWMNANTLRGSKRNIAAHYDLGNAFYKEWLDPSMTYSSALFQTGANDLETAQAEKYKALAQDMKIGPQDHVLEIGSGWGGFAQFAASEIGCRVTGLTISREQFDFASARIAEAGLAEKAQFKLQDYREETGSYDRVVSIEMFEAVGERYWPVFFDKVRACLKPGGTAGLQVITINEKAFPAYRAKPDFIQRYIFPGGMLPTPEILRRLGGDRGLPLIRERIFAHDYARTLNEWRQRFHASWERIRPLGFDERFRKLWEFYLHYCEAGFRAEYIDVRQVVFRG